MKFNTICRTTAKCKQSRLPHIAPSSRAKFVSTRQTPYIGIIAQYFFNKFMGDGDVTTKRRWSRTS